MSTADAGHERAIRDAVLAGRSDAWHGWFDAHYAPLARYARWRCGGLPDLTDDVIQETWLTAVRRVRDFDPAKGSFFDWLCGIASNAARSAVRSRYRRTARVRALQPADDRAAPDEGGAVERAERVALALAELPERYEAVLRAKYLDQQAVADIAAHRNESAKAVESLLARARAAFREVYEKSHD
ncbi:RNA polymerase sigma factor [Gemmata obscuriglobus]|uniref:Sigma-70 family RNA polymerase sigma factor n=1 Tax=Gemmata obscuriglobus TaxID=114 RepID=A0A2Z3GR05_9BACT|nr:sigma-70 family RNA polymerase sigma factor [Gemmata obscuriglobus]AWM35718.1 hypothetical protein C1280_00890 [Gemmata obscuriglobus]QEG31751.1 RNA polymerase sigma factor [Gemmata obscuriglobus]VTS11097.1 rna polymerase sigma70 factor : Marine sediment metagenome DNA, contig: S01H1_L06536 OS=marine sediment metagenome GN=S01H1_15949 PE=4 SV=1: Sigma70_r2: Sigma70_r4_2 [Gemmata obscuriglobus UQM 2246]